MPRDAATLEKAAELPRSATPSAVEIEKAGIDAMLARDAVRAEEAKQRRREKEATDRAASVAKDSHDGPRRRIRGKTTAGKKHIAKAARVAAKGIVMPKAKAKCTPRATMSKLVEWEGSDAFVRKAVAGHCVRAKVIAATSRGAYCTKGSALAKKAAQDEGFDLDQCYAAGREGWAMATEAWMKARG
jgi:hypothetical protein